MEEIKDMNTNEVNNQEQGNGMLKKILIGVGVVGAVAGAAYVGVKGFLKRRNGSAQEVITEEDVPEAEIVEEAPEDGE